MTDITIPPEALEAFLREVEAHEKNISCEAARAACLAMLRAWPGMVVDRMIYMARPCKIILPLPQKENEG